MYTSQWKDHPSPCGGLCFHLGLQMVILRSGTLPGGLMIMAVLGTYLYLKAFHQAMSNTCLDWHQSGSHLRHPFPLNSFSICRTYIDVVSCTGNPIWSCSGWELFLLFAVMASELEAKASDSALVSNLEVLKLFLHSFTLKLFCSFT